MTLNQFLLNTSGPRFGDLTDRLEKMSYFRDTTDESSHSTSTTDDKLTARPPRAGSDFRRSVGLATPVGGGGRFMDVPSSSKSSSRSNVSPFGRTPPSSSPNVSRTPVALVALFFSLYLFSLSLALSFPLPPLTLLYTVLYIPLIYDLHIYLSLTVQSVLRNRAILTRFRFRFRFRLLIFLHTVPAPVMAPVSYINLRKF
jgi:hypothetical protein